MEGFKDYHVHLYYEFSDIEVARELTETIKKKFDLAIGTLWNKPVGPHPKGSCQISVGDKDFHNFVTWLMVNRGTIDAFIHPCTNNSLLDHTQYIMWLGKSYDLNTKIFE